MVLFVQDFNSSWFTVSIYLFIDNESYEAKFIFGMCQISSRVPMLWHVISSARKGLKIDCLLCECCVLELLFWISADHQDLISSAFGLFSSAATTASTSSSNRKIWQRYQKRLRRRDWLVQRPRLVTLYPSEPSGSRTLTGVWL